MSSLNASIRRAAALALLTLALAAGTAAAQEPPATPQAASPAEPQATNSAEPQAANPAEPQHAAPLAASASAAKRHGHGDGQDTAQAAAGQSGLADLPSDSVTHHAITVGGTRIAYTATAGTLPLTDRHGAETAKIFYVAFTRDGVGDNATRPITYIFNGGPGASSAYLDIGAIGPRVLDFGNKGTPAPTSDQVTDNPDTWLPFTDLVFIDPVGTGYSRAAGSEEQEAKQFWGVEQDLEELAHIIRLHLTRTGRLVSPLYLVGESYGGFRAAELAYNLPATYGIAPAGVVLISPVIDFKLMRGGEMDVLPWALRLPSYAATAMADRGRIDEAALADAEHFALNGYLTALAAGPPAGPAATQLYTRLAGLTGLDASDVAHWRGRIPEDGYLKHLHRSDGQVVSRYDATVSVPDPDPWSTRIADDPVLDASIAPFTRGFVAYARDELAFRSDLPFELLSHQVVEHWNWSQGRGPTHDLSASDALRQGLALEPKMKLMITHGLTDVVTPYMMSRYVADHLPAAERPRISLKLYDGGHMLYLRADSRHRLHADAQSFYAAPPAE